MAVFLAGPGPVAEGAPVLQIRDRSEILLEPVYRVDGRVIINGRVIERASGDGTPYAEVKLWINERRVKLYADEGGYFSYSFDAAELPAGGGHHIKLDFSGDGLRDGSTAELEDFDLRKQPLRIDIELPPQVELGADSLHVPISTRSASSPVSIRMELFIEEDGQREKRPLPPLESNAQGQATLTLDAELLASPGNKTLYLHFRGDEELDSAKVQKRLQVVSKTELSLRLSDADIERGDRLRASGRLLDGSGEAISGAAIALELGDEVIASSRTDERGDYRIDIDSEELGLGPLNLQASFSPTQSWLRSSRSKPRTVTIAERQPVPIHYTLAAFGLTSLALLSFVAMRTRPWTKWKRAGDKDDEDEGDVLVDKDQPPRTGLAPNKRARNVTLRRVSHFDLHGKVRDAVSRKVIPGAELRLIPEAGGPEVEATGDEAGRFLFEPQQAGSHKLEVRAHGYVRELVLIELPHRGELHDARIDLMPVREKIFALYKEEVRHLLPKKELWGIWTPRQILDHVRSQKQSPALARLTSFVEESFFSQRIPGEEQIDRARRRIIEVRREAASDVQES